KAGGPSHVSVVYEAGPTGFGLYRELRRRGYRCEMRENWPASSGLSPARRSSAKPFDWQWPEAMRHGIRREEPSVTLRRKAPGNPRN
ncbi:MAG: IS110 family transposase, partial [Aquabacterium sp.]